MSEVDNTADAPQNVCIKCGRELDEDDAIESGGDLCFECYCWHEVETTFWHGVDAAFQRRIRRRTDRLSGHQRESTGQTSPQAGGSGLWSALQSWRVARKVPPS